MNMPLQHKTPDTRVEQIIKLAIMAVGVIFSNRALRGSCGGPAILDPDGDPIACGNCNCRAPEPEHAQSYFQLGRLYNESGNVEKAREVWRRGLALFPDDDQLNEMLEVSSKR